MPVATGRRAAPTIAGPRVGVRVVAAVLGLTARRIQQLVHEGVIPRAERGRYDITRAVQGYVHWLRDKLAEAESRATAAAARPAPTEDRDRRARAEAELMELRLARERGLLVAVADVLQERAQEYAEFASVLDALPAREVPRWPEVPPGVALRRLQDATLRVKTELVAIADHSAPNAPAAAGVAA